MCLCTALPLCEEQLKGVSRRRDWRLTERIEPVDRTFLLHHARQGRDREREGPDHAR